MPVFRYLFFSLTAEGPGLTEMFSHMVSPWASGKDKRAPNPQVAASNPPPPHRLYLFTCYTNLSIENFLTHGKYLHWKILCRNFDVDDEVIKFSNRLSCYINFFKNEDLISVICLNSSSQWAEIDFYRSREPNRLTVTNNGIYYGKTQLHTLPNLISIIANYYWPGTFFFRHENSCFRRRIRHKLLVFGSKSTIFGKYVILKNETYKSLLYFTNMSLRSVSGKMLCLSAMKFFNTENSLSTGTDVHGANL